MNPVFVSTRCLEPNRDAVAVVEAYRSQGLRAIELGSTHCYRADLFDCLRRFTDCRFIIHNYFPPPREEFIINLGSTDPAIRSRSRNLILDNLDNYAALGATQYSVHAPYRVEPDQLGRPFRPDQVQEYEAVYGNLLESTRLLAAAARSRGIRLALENTDLAPYNLVGGKNELLLFVEADEIVRFFRDLNDPGVGLLVDLGHLKVSATTLTFDPAEFLDRVRPYLFGLHLSENDGTRDQNRPVTPSTLRQLDALALADLTLTLELDRCPIETIRENAGLVAEYLAERNGQ